MLFYDPVDMVFLRMLYSDSISNYDEVLTGLLEYFWNSPSFHNIERVGAILASGFPRLPFFTETCTVKRDGVYVNGLKTDPVTGILITRYLIESGYDTFHHDWVSYREFQDGAFFATYIRIHIEEVLAKEFSGRSHLLSEHIAAIGGITRATDSGADLSSVITPFPKIPVLCQFWDRDNELPSSFQFLYDRSARSYLDLESLADLLECIALSLKRGTVSHG